MKGDKLSEESVTMVMNFNDAEFYTSFGKLSQMPKSDRIEIAFSGRSNVGKSSLINKIFNRKNLARVSSVPGKTITINFFKLEKIYIVDLPGYGYAKVAKNEKRKWSDLIGGYISDSERDLELVFQLIDMRHAPTKDDLQMIDFLIQNEMPFVIVFTKADKLKPTARNLRMKEFAKEIPYFEDITYVEFSSETGEGVDKIREIIEEVAQDAEIYTDVDESTGVDESENAENELYEEEEISDEDLDTGFTGGFLTPRGR